MVSEETGGESGVTDQPNWAWVMVDSGSDIEAVSGEVVRAMGLGKHMRLRKAEDRQRVRGVGTAEGQGEVITHDVWMSISVPGKRLTGWGKDMAPTEGEDTKLIVQGWWAVIEEMGMPIILGGKALAKYDQMPRQKVNKIVMIDKLGIQYSENDSARIVLDGYSMARMIAVARHEHMWNPIYDTRVWADLARNSVVAKVSTETYHTDKQKVMPNLMTEVKLRYSGRCDLQALSRVEVVRAKVHGQWGIDQDSVYVSGWAAKDVISTCRGHPTVLVFNHSDKPVWIHRGEIEARVIPLQEVVTYSLVSEQEESAWREAEDHFQKDGPPVVTLKPINLTEEDVAHIKRPEQFPQMLWQCADPNLRAGVATQFAEFPAPLLDKCINHLMYDTSVYADGRAVTVKPWEWTMQPKHLPATEAVAQEEGRVGEDDAEVEEAEGVDSESDSESDNDEITAEPTENNSMRVKRRKRLANAKKKKAGKEKVQATLAKIEQALEGGNRVMNANILHEDEEDVVVTPYMRVQDYFKDCKRIDRERITKSKREVKVKAKDRTPEEVQADDLLREAKDAEDMRVRREKRVKDFFVNGVATEMAYFVAQAICCITSYFHPDPDNPPTVKGFIAEIETTDNIPIVARARKFAEVQKAFLNAKTKELIRQGKLEKSTGDYASSLVLVAYDERIRKFMERWGDRAHEMMWLPEHEKEVATFYRCTCDYRMLNLKSKSDVFPLPRIDDLLDQIKMGTKHFTSGDVENAFWTVKLAEHCREKTAMRTHNDHLQWTVLPQGWKGAANYWARVVARVFENIVQDEALVYQDDVLVHSREFAEHYRSLGKVYACLKARRLTFKLTKTHINFPSMAFLGHVIDETGRYPNPEKIKAIMEQDYPNQDTTAVRSFIGQTLYYRNYIYDYANKIAPLNAMVKKGVILKDAWGPEQIAAVDQLKEDLCMWPVLMLVDNSKPFQVRVDACRRGHGIGGVLLQQDDANEWRPVSWWSRSLSPAEKEYAATELECKALHDIIMYFDVYLQGTKFDVYTDANSLLYLVKGQTATNNGRLMRYLMDIQAYTFALHYKAGKIHIDADAVSRLLKFGEKPTYLTVDDLEWDTGPVGEEEIQIAKDLDERRKRRQRKAIDRKAEAAAKRKAEQITLEVAQEWPKEVVQGVSVDCGAASETLWQKGHSITKDEVNNKRQERRMNTIRGGKVGDGQVVQPKGKYHLRPRSTKPAQQVLKADGHNNIDGRESPPEAHVMKAARKCGYNRVKVTQSTIEAAGQGLFINGKAAVKGGKIVCSYEGQKLSKEEAEASKSAYIFEFEYLDETYYIDAESTTSCYGRFANDKRDDSKVNAKILVRGGKLFVMAMMDIQPGEEVFIDYGVDYWMDHLDVLSDQDRAEVESRAKYTPINITGRKKVEAGNLTHMDTVAPKARAEVVKMAIGQQSEQDRAKYMIKSVREISDQDLETHMLDNIIQCEELADERHVQELVGKEYIDDDNGQLYMVDSIQYDEYSKTVVGWRRSKSGKLHIDDDAAHYVFGEGGLYQLVELYNAEEVHGQVMWPASREEWALRQREDPELEVIRVGIEGQEEGEVYKVRGHEVNMRENDGIHLLKRKCETVGGVTWQTWVPAKLQELCMQLHHEQSAHPGMDRTLKTMKNNYFWESMRIETQNHCASCRMCELRKAYHGRAKVPVQKYPGVASPLSRLHIDLTGMLPETTGNGSRYILVVKDYHTKFVWLFAIKNKDAISVADMLVTELYCRWGIPEMLVSDRGSEFRNKLEARINHIFKVNKIATTPYNPRANGFVEQHNKTLKDQLFNFVDTRQKDWDVFLPTVQLMYNTTVSMTTLRTPYFLMFGRECNMPHIGGLMDRTGEVLTPAEGVDAVGAREATLYEEWEDKLVSALQLAWEFTTDRAHANAARGNNAISRQRGLVFKEYEEGQWFYRKRNQVRVFKSVQDKENYKISRKLQARWEGPYKITRKVSAVLYEAVIDGEKKRVHAINMKPKAVVKSKLKDVVIEDTGLAEIMN